MNVQKRKAPKKAGSRYPLLIYRRAMDRLWKATLVLGLLLAFAWLWYWFNITPLIETGGEVWLLVGAVFTLGFTIFAFFGRYVAYVQPRRDHLRLVTPFLRLKISYRRVHSIHPASFAQLYPPNEVSWAQKRFLMPFYGKTAVVVELNAYPMSPSLLRFFLAPQMFSPQTKAFVLLVPDWMALSTELDSMNGAWMRSQGPRRAAPGRLR